VGIAEDKQLDRELRTAARTKPVQLVNNASSKPSDWIGVGVSSVRTIQPTRTQDTNRRRDSKYSGNALIGG
jgi:hypothetical protein